MPTLILYPLALCGRIGRAWIDSWSVEAPLVRLCVNIDRKVLARTVTAGDRDHLEFIKAMEAAI